MIGFHQLFSKGDRKACIRFGIMIGEVCERHAEWCRTHPEFCWWKRCLGVAGARPIAQAHFRQFFSYDEGMQIDRSTSGE
jgi:hypothetical protein